MLGYACLTVRHLLDPEVIVLGGGLVEACSDFMMPIVENVVGSDRLPGARDGGQVLLSALGDDAVVLGAVALARKRVGRSPFKKRFAVRPTYPLIDRFSFGEIVVGGKAYHHDVYIPVNGKVKARDKALAKKEYGNAHTIGPKELEEVCKGGPEVLVRRRRRREQGRVAGGSPAIPEPAGHPLRGPDHGEPGRGLQQVAGPQGRADPRDLLNNGGVGRPAPNVRRGRETRAELEAGSGDPRRT